MCVTYSIPQRTPHFGRVYWHSERNSENGKIVINRSYTTVNYCAQSRYFSADDVRETDETVFELRRLLIE